SRLTQFTFNRQRDGDCCGFYSLTFDRGMPFPGSVKNYFRVRHSTSAESRKPHLSRGLGNSSGVSLVGQGIQTGTTAVLLDRLQDIQCSRERAPTVFEGDHGLAAVTDRLEEASQLCAQRLFVDYLGFGRNDVRHRESSLAVDHGVRRRLYR